MFLKIPARRPAGMAGDVMNGEISFHHDQVVCISKMRSTPNPENKDPANSFSIILANDMRYFISEEVYELLLSKLHPEELQ